MSNASNTSDRIRLKMHADSHQQGAPAQQIYQPIKSAKVSKYANNTEKLQQNESIDKLITVEEIEK